jgi:hypothetical protein
MYLDVRKFKFAGVGLAEFAALVIFKLPSFTCALCEFSGATITVLIQRRFSTNSLRVSSKDDGAIFKITLKFAKISDIPDDSAKSR